MDFVIIITGQSRNGQSDVIKFIQLGLDTELLGRINDRSRVITGGYPKNIR